MCRVRDYIKAPITDTENLELYRNLNFELNSKLTASRFGLCSFIENLKTGACYWINVMAWCVVCVLYQYFKVIYKRVGNLLKVMGVGHCESSEVEEINYRLETVQNIFDLIVTNVKLTS
jgi:hypothetical protein